MNLPAAKLLVLTGNGFACIRCGNFQLLPVPCYSRTWQTSHTTPHSGILSCDKIWS